MDYFDELDQEALDAFTELNDGIPAFSPTKPSQNKRPRTQKRRNVRGIKYLCKLEQPITAAELSAAAILPTQPQIVDGEGEEGSVQFCLLEEYDLSKVKAWLAEKYPAFSALSAPVNMAYKELSPTSIYPTLGVDATMPQYRPDKATASTFLPAQDQILVWYFFYGTLANSAFPAELFGLVDSVPVLHRATIYGGRLQTWGKKYKALVDSPGSQVEGWAYKVQSRDNEDALRVYGTAKYEVVRVSIVFKESPYEDQVLQGCTFRFAGDAQELDEC